MANNDYPIQKGDDLFPVTIAPPASYIIDSTDADSPETQSLLARNKGVVDQFVTTQRRNYALSGLPQQKAVFSSPELDVHYLNQMGRERISLVPRAVRQPVAPTPEPTGKPKHVHGVVVVQNPVPIDYACLLVLFDGSSLGLSDNLVGVIRMGDIDPLSAACGAPWYIGALPQGSWGGQRFTVNQLNLDGIGAILTPVDFTPDANPVAADTHILYTPLLTNGAVTQLESVQVPIMNGDPSSKIYTPLDVFQGDDKGSFSRSGDGAIDRTVIYGVDADNPGSGGSFQAGMPYAISPDGDYYYAPSWYSNYAVLGLNLGYSYPYAPAAASPYAPTAVSFSATPATLPTDYPDPKFQNFFSFSDAESTAFNNYSTVPAMQGPQYISPNVAMVEAYDEVSNCSITIYIRANGGNDTDYGTVAASGGVMSSQPAADPTVLDAGFALSSYWYRDPNNFNETFIQGSFDTAQYGGNLPVPEYQVPNTGSTGNDVVAAAMVDLNIQAAQIYQGPEGIVNTPTTAYWWPIANQWYANLLGNSDSAFAGGNLAGLTFVSGDISDDANGNQILAGYSMYDDLLQAGFTPVSGEAEFDSYTTAAGPSQWPGYATTEADGNGLDQSLFNPRDPSWQGPTFEPFAASASGASSYAGIEAAEQALMPTTCTITNEDTLNDLFSDTESMALFDFSQEGVVAGDDYTFLLLEPFPPALSAPFPPGLSLLYANPPASPAQGSGYDPHWYTVETGTFDGGFGSTETHTPYGPYKGTVQTSFKPWLHVSDGTFFAQGFAIDDTPYLFLNGNDFMTPLTKALRCKPSEIHAIYMDVPLSVCLTLGAQEVQPSLIDLSAPTTPSYWPAGHVTWTPYGVTIGRPPNPIPFLTINSPVDD